MSVAGTKAKSITPTAEPTEKLPDASLTLPDYQETPIDPSLPSQDQLAALQTRNKQLHDLLQKLDKHSQNQDSEFEKLKAENVKLKSEKEQWTSQKDVVEKQNQDLETENQLMSQRVVELEEELTNSKSERDSLDTMLKYLNDELVASEQRNRKHAGSGSSS